MREWTPSVSLYMPVAQHSTSVSPNAPAKPRHSSWIPPSGSGFPHSLPTAHFFILVSLSSRYHFLVLAGNTHPDDYGNNDPEKDKAGNDGAEAHTAVGDWLR